MSDWRRYDDLAVGDTFPDEPYCFDVTAAVAGEFRDVTARSRVDASASAAGRAAVPPMLAAVYIRGAQNALKGPPGGIHAKQRFEFLKQVHVGDALETVLTIMDKFEKKGRRYIVSQTRTRNQNGDDVTVGEIVSIWGQEQ